MERALPPQLPVLMRAAFIFKGSGSCGSVSEGRRERGLCFPTGLRARLETPKASAMSLKKADAHEDLGSVSFRWFGGQAVAPAKGGVQKRR